VIPKLAETARVIAPDFLGHGYSDRRDFFDRSLLAQTEMIMRLMDHLVVERADFVGHDTGGGVALIMAINHPERVARLVLTNVVAYDSWPIDDMIALGNPNWRNKSPRTRQDLPTSVKDLSNDPFRSLAGGVRESCGFKKSASTEDYLEFKWADYLRAHWARTGISTKDIDTNFDSATNAALRLAAQKDAADLPGYTGKMSCD
jgi:pimeloyl-ACP methyl ester carboxylesterase